MFRGVNTAVKEHWVRVPSQPRSPTTAQTLVERKGIGMRKNKKDMVEVRMRWRGRRWGMNKRGKRSKRRQMIMRRKQRNEASGGRKRGR